MECGLLGEHLSHSYSPFIHRNLGDYEYKLYEKTPEELPAFLQSKQWDALNVTIPYKKTVIPYCSALSEEAAAIGSVNTLLHLPDGKLYGDNTDAYGFGKMIEKSGISVVGKKVLIFGSGGAAVTARAVLSRMGAGEIITISRTGENNYTNLSRHKDAQILVNTTPLGMYPDTGKAPVSLRDFPCCEGVLDVVYNPVRTAFLLEAEELGIPHQGGLTMLIYQAIRAAELFTNTAIDPQQASRIEKLIRREKENIILIGMPGCGKTTAGKILSLLLSRPFVDSDILIEQSALMSIAEIFEKEGEAGFRQRESQVLAELGKQSGLVIATGGGCVTVPENYPSLHQNGYILWLQRDLDQLATEDRPLSQLYSAKELYARRADAYARFADGVVSNNGTIDELKSALWEVLQ